jgi:hypothetical protein
VAFPTIPTTGASRVLTTTQLNNTSPRTFPDLSSLTKNSGDLLIAIIYCYQSTAAAGSIFSSWGGGFTELADLGGGTNGCLGIAYKWSTGSETGTFTVAQAATITGDAAMILLSIPGAHASTVPEITALASGTSAAADPASLSPSWGAEDTLWIAVGGNGMTSITGSWTGMGSAPTNYTDYVDCNPTDTSVIGDADLAVAFQQLNASSEDAGGFTTDLSNARNHALVIAVRPAPPPPLPPYAMLHTPATRVREQISRGWR